MKNTIISIIACVIAVVAMVVAFLPNDGKDGKDGVTPIIEINSNGYWVINGVVTEHKAVGQDGKNGQDALTPTIEISDDGYWVINGEKTDVKASPEQNVTENPQGLDFYLLDDGTYAVSLGNAKYLSNITFPSSYNGKKVTRIVSNQSSFAVPSDYRHLTSVTIPETITHIEDFAFEFCVDLTNIDLPSNLLHIGERAFWGCTSLASITIPNSVTSIGDQAFGQCTALTSITIPDSVTTIGGGLFYECSTLTYVVLGAGLTEIKSGQFGPGMFEGCTSLASINIPNNITSIGAEAFYDCKMLTNITFEGTVEQWRTINLGAGWNGEPLFFGTGGYIPATEVICSNGTVPISLN